MVIAWPEVWEPNITPISSLLPDSLPNELFVITHICLTNVDSAAALADTADETYTKQHLHISIAFFYKILQHFIHLLYVHDCKLSAFLHKNVFITASAIQP